MGGRRWSVPERELTSDPSDPLDEAGSRLATTYANHSCRNNSRLIAVWMEAGGRDFMIEAVAVVKGVRIPPITSCRIEIRTHHACSRSRSLLILSGAWLRRHSSNQASPSSPSAAVQRDPARDLVVLDGPVRLILEPQSLLEQQRRRTFSSETVRARGAPSYARGRRGRTAV